MNRIKISCTLILYLLSVVSCIREDLAPCPQNMNHLQFEFSYDGMRELHDDELYMADVYVFDHDDRLVARQEIANPVISHIYTADFNLETGDYSIVVWFNQVAPYSTRGFEAIRSAKQEAEMHLDVPSDRCISAILPTQLYGFQKFESMNNKGDQHITIPLTENTNRINLTVRGLAKNEHTYSYSIADNNGNYYFDNTFAPCEEFQYTTTTHFGDSNVLTSSLTVLRLAENRHPKLSFRDVTTGKTIYPYRPGQIHDLIEMISIAYANGPRIDFDKTHVYDIVISFDSNMTVSIIVNGWELTLDEREL